MLDSLHIRTLYRPYCYKTRAVLIKITSCNKRATDWLLHKVAHITRRSILHGSPLHRDWRSGSVRRKSYNLAIQLYLAGNSLLSVSEVRNCVRQASVSQSGPGSIRRKRCKKLYMGLRESTTRFLAVWSG